jgi:hypothetical protein
VEAIAAQSYFALRMVGLADFILKATTLQFMVEAFDCSYCFHFLIFKVINCFAPTVEFETTCPEPRIFTV